MRKKMTPFCLPNYNIHTSYVGATYHVARFPATGQALWQTKRTQIPARQQKNDAILPTKLQHTHKLRRGDQSGRPLSGYRCLDNRIETDKWNAYSPLPDKPCGEQNGRKYPSHSKKMTPFCLPNYNIKASYVGATYHVARNHMSQRQRATGGQCLHDLSCRPLSG